MLIKDQTEYRKDRKELFASFINTNNFNRKPKSFIQS